MSVIQEQLGKNATLNMRRYRRNYFRGGQPRANSWKGAYVKGAWSKPWRRGQVIFPWLLASQLHFPSLLPGTRNRRMITPYPSPWKVATGRLQMTELPEQCFSPCGSWPIWGIAYQITCLSDIDIILPNSRKPVIMKQQKTFHGWGHHNMRNCT